VNSRDHSILRTLLGIVLPALTVAAALLPLWLLRSRLPEPLATHWSLGGTPNGAMPISALTLLVGVMSGAAAAMMAIFARRRPAIRGEIAAPVAIAGFVAGLIASVSWFTVSANLDAASWRYAQNLGFGRMVLALLAGGLLATALAWAARPLESAATLAPDIPRAGLAPGVRVVWVSSARAGWAAPLVIFGTAIAALMVQVSINAALGALLVGAAGLFFTSIRMTVDRSGVEIAYGLFGWPVQRVQLADIRQATALKIEPMTWGGWGYRGSLRMMRRAAVVLRGGEGMKLELSGDRVLAITIDDATQGAGVLNDLVLAQRGSVGPAS
jgi:hypothetical protein